MAAMIPPPHRALTATIVLHALAALGGCARTPATLDSTTPTEVQATGELVPAPAATPLTPPPAEPEESAQSATSLASGAAADPVPAPEEEPLDPPVDMTPAAAPTICASLEDDPSSLRRSAFRRGGVTLADGSRADVLECASSDAVNGETVRAYLVIRTPGEAYVTSTMLGEAYDVPGNSLSYRLGRLERRPTGVRMQATQTDTIYPCTGDPSESCPPEVERARVTVSCARDPEYGTYDCERE